MGTSWMFVNEKRREFLCASTIDQGDKSAAIPTGDVARILAHLMLHQWRGDHVRAISEYDETLTGVDPYDLFLRRDAAWTDVTVAAGREFNEFYSGPDGWAEPIDLGRAGAASE